MLTSKAETIPDTITIPSSSSSSSSSGAGALINSKPHLQGIKFIDVDDWLVGETRNSIDIVVLKCSVQYGTLSIMITVNEAKMRKKLAL